MASCDLCNGYAPGGGLCFGCLIRTSTKEVCATPDPRDAELSALRARVAELETQLAAANAALDDVRIIHASLTRDRDAARRDLKAATYFVIGDHWARRCQDGTWETSGFVNGVRGVTRDAALAEARRLAGEK